MYSMNRDFGTSKNPQIPVDPTSVNPALLSVVQFTMGAEGNVVEPSQSVPHTLQPLGASDGGEQGTAGGRPTSQLNSICCRGLETSPPTCVIMTSSSDHFQYIKQSIGYWSCFGTNTLLCDDTVIYKNGPSTRNPLLLHSC